MRCSTQAATVLYFAASAVAVAPHVGKRQETCRPEDTVCPPPSSNGYSTDPTYPTEPPPDNNNMVGFNDETAGLMEDLGSGGLSMSERRRGLKRRDETLCCTGNQECRLLKTSGMPVCYDPLTTDFTLADGSNGNDNTGDFYSVPDNANINLRTGDYVFANGTSGNYFDDEGLSRPTATGSLPQPTENVISSSNTASSSRATSTSSGSSSSSALALQHRITDPRYLCGIVGLAIVLFFC